MKVIKHKTRSSPEKRAKVRQRLDALKVRQAEIKSATVPTKRWTELLIKAARFAVDVKGDYPSLEGLQLAVEEAEKQTALAEEWDELRKEIDAIRGDVDYHQYLAGRDAGYAFIVSGQGDTRKEALENAKRK